MDRGKLRHQVAVALRDMEEHVRSLDSTAERNQTLQVAGWYAAALWNDLRAAKAPEASISSATKRRRGCEPEHPEFFADLDALTELVRNIGVYVAMVI